MNHTRSNSRFHLASKRSRKGKKICPRFTVLPATNPKELRLHWLSYEMTGVDWGVYEPEKPSKLVRKRR